TYTAGIRFDNSDILDKKIPTLKGMPFATVLTLPATGSEMNSGAVITRSETKQKLTMGGPGLFPVFSVLDPTVVKSIPQRQISNGLADAFTHVLEQYMTYPVGALLQDRIAESILQTLVEVAPTILKDPTDYKAASNFMWSCTMALNGLIQKGVPTDWAIHIMGHELTALFGIDHARTLAILTDSHYSYNFETKKEKLAQYAERVWGIKQGSTEERARIGIEKTVTFFHAIGIKTKLSDYTNEYEGTGSEIARRLKERGMIALGEHGTLTPEDAEKIVEMSY
ncbi:MAG: iron-containing alcohol dehydrogenase, partial [Vicingaceae bacterium]